jgi:hypothetical protein
VQIITPVPSWARSSRCHDSHDYFVNLVIPVADATLSLTGVNGIRRNGPLTESTEALPGRTLAHSVRPRHGAPSPDRCSSS